MEEKKYKQKMTGSIMSLAGLAITIIFIIGFFSGQTSDEKKDTLPLIDGKVIKETIHNGSDSLVYYEWKVTREKVKIVYPNVFKSKLR